MSIAFGVGVLGHGYLSTMAALASDCVYETSWEYGIIHRLLGGFFAVRSWYRTLKIVKLCLSGIRVVYNFITSPKPWPLSDGHHGLNGVP
jgi:hypothetical protein